MNYPDLNNLLNFELTIEPDEVGDMLCTSYTRVQGFYKRGRFHFTFTINDNYPHDPPASFWKWQWERRQAGLPQDPPRAFQIRSHLSYAPYSL